MQIYTKMKMDTAWIMHSFLWSLHIAMQTMQTFALM